MIDLRTQNQNPWAQFLPQLFQQMVIGKLQNKFAIEQLKAKATDDALKTKEQREYTEQQDIKKRNMDMEDYTSKKIIDTVYDTPKEVKPEWGMIYNPQTKQYVWGKKTEGAIAKPEDDKSSTTWEQLEDISLPDGSIIKQQKSSAGKVERYTIRKNKDGSETKLQLKTKKYLGKDGKTYGQLQTFDPKTGKVEDSGKPFETPKTANIWDFLGGGPGGAGEQADDISPLIEQIKQLQDALNSIQGQ